MIVKSEFDPHSSYTYVILNENGDGFCLEDGTYTKSRTFSDNIDRMKTAAHQLEESDMDDHNFTRLIINANAIIAKLALSLIQYRWN